MNYPDFKQLLGSKSDNSDGVLIDRAADGSVRTRATWDKRRRTFSVRHALTAAEYTELLMFYDGRRGADAAFDFEWRGDGEMYRCVFSSSPKEDSIELTSGGKRYFVTCSLAEV